MGRFSDLLAQDRSHLTKASQLPQDESATVSKPDDWVWEVVGGQDKGGIVVRAAEDPSSDKFDDRLSCGAWVRELETVGNRLRYVKLSGEGPARGWVSLSLKDRELLRRVELPAPGDEGPSDDEAPRSAAGRRPAPPAAAPPPPREPGSGALYEVVAPQVAVRAAPSLGAPAQFSERRGAVVELHEWDETRAWRMVVDRCGQPGWMMLDHPRHGALLRPAGLPFQRDPLSPVAVAAMENDVEHLQKFITAGLDVNAPDAGGLTPLMLAARADHADSVLVLMRAGAGAGAAARTSAGQSAVDLAPSRATQALLLALTLRDFDPEHCLEAAGRLRPELMPLAQRQLQVPLRMQRERLARTAAGAPAVAAAGAAAAAAPSAPAPAAGAGGPGGPGERYRVAARVATVRAEPSLAGDVVSSRRRGELVAALGRDATGRWLQVPCAWTDRAGEEHAAAWMLTEHPDTGALLQRL